MIIIKEFFQYSMKTHVISADLRHRGNSNEHP